MSGYDKFRLEESLIAKGWEQSDGGLRPPQALVDRLALRPAFSLNDARDLDELLAGTADALPTCTIDNVTEAYIFASSGYVNTARRGGAYTSQHPYETATVTLNVGQRMIVERVDQGVMRLEVLP